MLTTDTPPLQSTSTSSPPPPPLISSSSSPIISLRDVNYSYPTRPDHIVLRNISMNFRMQAIQIIIGKSGSGKSTLLSLLCGLYHPTAGDISITGFTNSSVSLNLDWVRAHIGVVEQSAKLFSGTIRENICYGSQVWSILSASFLTFFQLEVTQQEIEEVAKSVNAHEFILSLPDGYDTQVSLMLPPLVLLCP